MSTWDKNMETKERIRARLSIKRDALEPEVYRQAEEAIALQLKQMEVIKERGYIYGYYPLGKELSLLKFLDWALEAGKRVALPKVEGSEMDFYEITSLQEVKKGSFGVMEPVTGQKVNWEEAVCLTPGVGFDRQGNRIGHGAGYYDRYFEIHPRLIRMGIAYEFQVVKEIPAEETDIGMEYLITPGERIISYREREGSSA